MPELAAFFPPPPSIAKVNSSKTTCIFLPKLTVQKSPVDPRMVHVCLLHLVAVALVVWAARPQTSSFFWFSKPFLSENLLALKIIV